MLEKFLEHVNKPVGYLVLIGIVFAIICIKINSKKQYKPRGYIKLNEEYQKSAMYLCVFVSLFITIFFFILNLMGLKDKTGGTLEYHVILGVILFFSSVCAFLYYNGKNIIFNEIEIKVCNFFGKYKVYYWQDIIEVKNIKNEKLVIKTINGKFKINFYLKNVDKFIKELEERNLVHEDLSKFGVNKVIIASLDKHIQK